MVLWVLLVIQAPVGTALKRVTDEKDTLMPAERWPLVALVLVLLRL